jgi:hypothetical protein
MLLLIPLFFFAFVFLSYPSFSTQDLENGKGRQLVAGTF